MRPLDGYRVLVPRLYSLGLMLEQSSSHLPSAGQSSALALAAAITCSPRQEATPLF